MADIFVSYSRRDKEFVEKLVQSLASEGRDVWVDWEDIPVTADWLEEIYGGIQRADTFVYVISPDSVQSEVCGWELKYAVENKKRFVPILYREIVEDDDKAKMHPAVSSHNWLFFRENDDYDENFKLLVTAIDTDLDHVREHTRLLVRAREWDKRNRSNSFVLTGDELAEAEKWLASASDKNPEPTELHYQYIYASRRVATRRQRLIAVASMVAAGVSLVLAVLAVIGFSIANDQRNIAEEQREVAERNATISQSLAIAANAQLELEINNNDRAIALALEAVNIDNPPVESQRILEASTYAPGTRAVYTGHSDGVNTIAFSPDGDVALSGGRDNLVIVWDVAAGESLRQFEEHEAPVREVLFTSDGAQALSADETGLALLWDVESLEVVARFEGEHTDAIQSASFSADGSLLLTTGSDSLALVWDVAEAEVVLRLEGHVNAVYDGAFSPDGSVVATGSEDFMLIVWDLDEDSETYGESLYSVDTNSQVTSVVFSPDGSQIITGAADFSVDVWNAVDGMQNFALPGHLQTINSVAVDQTGLYALSASNDTTVRLWNLLNQSEVQRFGGHTREVTDIEFSPDGRRALSASLDGTLRLWDLSHGSEQRRLDGHFAPVVTAGFNADGSMAYTASWDTSVILWNMDTYRPIGTLPGHIIFASAADLSDDGTQILVGDGGGMVLWDVATQEQICRFESPAPVLTVDLSPDGTRAIAGAVTQQATIWDTENCDEPLFTLSGHRSVISSVAFSPDGTRAITTGGDDRVIIAWDAATGEEINRISYSEPVSLLAYNLDGTAIAATAGNRVVLLDAETGDVMRVFEGHSEPVNSLNFSADGTRLVTGAGDQTLRLWDAATGDELRRIQYGSAVRSVALSPDATLALAGYDDASVRLWNVTPPALAETRDWTLANRYIPTLTCDEKEEYRIPTGDECATEDEAEIGGSGRRELAISSRRVFDRTLHLAGMKSDSSYVLVFELCCSEG